MPKTVTGQRGTQTNKPFSVEVLVVENVKKCRLNFEKLLCCFFKDNYEFCISDFKRNIY